VGRRTLFTIVDDSEVQLENRHVWASVVQINTYLCAYVGTPEERYNVVFRWKLLVNDLRVMIDVEEDPLS
jgi:hypothetical protein